MKGETNTMSKNLSRRDFLKGAAASFAGVAAMGVLGACSNETDTTTAAPETTAAPQTTAAPETTAARTGKYIPGTYTSKAQGLGIVVVTMTFDENNITEVLLDVSAETANYGGAAAETLREAIMTAQSADIDVVAGASLTSNAVKKAAENCIKQATGEIPVEGTADKKEEGPAGWLGVAPEIAEADIVETWNTDLLIVGAGNAGLAAGAYAAEKGYDIRMIEKMGTTGKVRGWYGAVDSVDGLGAGEPPIDRARLRRELQRYASGKANMRAWNTWINESAAMHDFVKKMYAKYSPDSKVTVTTGTEAVWPDGDASGFFFPAVEHFWGFGQFNRNDMFKAYMEEHGKTIDFNTTMVKLEKDGDRVTGVIAQRTDSGEYIRINAAKGVILTTGGYPGNPDMMEQLDPLGTSVITTYNHNPQDTGDGIKAAMWAGASMQQEAAPMLFDRGLCYPGTDAGYKTLENGSKVFPSDQGQFNVGSQPFLKVNRLGQRFTNESGTYDHMSYAAANQPGHVYASIMDSNLPEDVVRFHTLGCSAGTRKNAKGTIDQLDKKAEAGYVMKADTLEELADKLGFDAEAKKTFLATCERYNELYDMGEDVDFGKPAYRLSQLRKPPYYGFWLGACILTTEQGVLINENAQVLDAKNMPMPGLYAAGDTTGGFFVDNYPCLMPGVACGKAMTFGIKAVKSAMGEEA